MRLTLFGWIERPGRHHLSLMLVFERPGRHTIRYALDSFLFFSDRLSGQADTNLPLIHMERSNSRTAWPVTIVDCSDYVEDELPSRFWRFIPFYSPLRYTYEMP